jgi:hypothetical protein
MTRNIKKVCERFNKIAQGQNEDASDEYYTLYHAFMDLFVELLCRYNAGWKYKVIICPCDSKTSIFHELENYADMIGNPRIIYSFYPEKDWKDYFDMDYMAEYGCKPEEVCIFTNPPFKGLSDALRKIKCDYLLFGSNVVGITGNTHAKLTGGFWYLKNNDDFTGNADQFKDKYGDVATVFYSNTQFLSSGRQYKNDSHVSENIMFGKDRLTEVKGV